MYLFLLTDCEAGAVRAAHTVNSWRWVRRNNSPGLILRGSRVYLLLTPHLSQALLGAVEGIHSFA